MFTFENISSILSLLGVGGVIGAYINHLFQKNREKERRLVDLKIQSYSNFIDFSRSFMGDPTLNYETAFKYQQEFIKKFHNDILLHSSIEVIESVDDFFDSVSISYSNKDEATDALFNMIATLRKDLGLKEDGVKNRHKYYTVNTEDLKKKKGA